MWSNEGSEPDGHTDASGHTATLTALNPPSNGPTPMPRHGSADLVPVTALPVVPGPRHAVAGFADGASDIPNSLAERVELCRFLADADLLPSALRKKPANVLLIMMKAAALDLPMAAALEHLYVIDGKVGHSAEMLRGLLARAGHSLSWPVSTDKEVVGQLKLRHDPHNPRTVRFTLADATRMGLTKKDNWTKDPESMLVARVTTRLVSRHCPEVSLALGNLSALDVEDEPTIAPDHPDPSTDTPDAAAARISGLLAAAARATSPDELKKLGQQAKAENLLELPVDTGGDGPALTVQQALLQRMQELSDARAAQPTTANTASTTTSGASGPGAARTGAHRGADRANDRATDRAGGEATRA